MLTPSAYQPGHLPGSSTIPNLGVGFILRCFQNLSFPDLATLRCPWQDSRHTSGQFTPVLSSRNSPVTRSADYIFILSYRGGIRMLAYYPHEQSFSKKRFLYMQVCSDVSSGTSRYGVKPFGRLPTVLSCLSLVLK